MKKFMLVVAAIVLLSVGVMAQAAPIWYTISFTGTEMFNYTTGVAPRADQDAPRRLRDWTDDTLNYKLESYEDANSNGTNDFAEWAGGSPGLGGFGFSYFNLWGDTIAPTSWDEPYHAVPDQGDGRFGVDSWRNQTVNGVAVIPSMGDPSGWAGGIVSANQTYNATNYAFPVWRAPTGTQLTMANAASLRFSVDVLMENPASAFEPDGTLRVWFGGFNAPQNTTGHVQEISGIMRVAPVPEPMSILLGIMGLGSIAGFTKLRRK